MRIGQSTDIHQLVEGRDLILGGEKIDHHLGLLGHSDADVLCHAIIEAIFGALALKDIGTHFPDTDPKYKGVSSIILLEETKRILDESNYKSGNIDSLVIIEEPKLAPYLDQMRENISKALDIEINQINIKATRGEKLGYIGRQEGVMAQAIVLLKEVKS